MEKVTPNTEDQKELDMNQVNQFVAAHVLLDQTPLVNLMFEYGKFTVDHVSNWDWQKLKSVTSHKWLIVTINIAKELKERKELVLETVNGVWWGLNWQEGKPLCDNAIIQEIFKDAVKGSSVEGK